MMQESRVLPPEELAKQQEYCEQLRQLLAQRCAGQPMAYTQTFGCQQNEADTELIRGMLVDMGAGLASTPSEADLIVINTCAVREHAEQRAFGNLGALSHLKREKPGLIICLCGCMAQQERVAEKVKHSYPYVDLVFGTLALSRFPELLYRRLTGGKRVFDVSGDPKGEILEGVRPVRAPGVRAWLSIMYGCNNFCSYCIVPYVRGRERSRSPQAVLDECRELVRAGYKEITLLGQNVNSYGADLGGEWDFAELLRQVNSIEGQFQVRFMTSHPKDASKKLFDTMAACDKVCKCIHLPVQSGSDRVLERMNRRYTAQQYLDLVDYGRSVMPGLAVTSDLIVGFPGETEADFEQTLGLVERVGYQSLFTFLYSRREGTAAAKMDDPATREEKQARFDRLLALQNSISRAKNEAVVGRSLRVLVDGKSSDPDYDLSARTESNLLVHLKGDETWIGGYATAQIDRCSTWALFGSVKE